MFTAVRNSILGLGRRIGLSWRALRSGGMLRLFLFEFMVVLCGVLAAQGLQNWSHERELDNYSSEAISRYEAELAAGLETAAIWDAALPCVRGRVDDIMRLAGEEPLPPSFLLRPGLWSNRVTPLSEEVEVRFRGDVRDNRVSAFKDSAAHINRIDRLGEAVAGEWQQFLRLDPDRGRIRESDIAAVRDAAARIHSDLSSIEISVDYLNAVLPPLGIAPTTSIEDGVRRLPLRDCSDFDRYGSVHRPEGDRMNTLDRNRAPLPAPDEDGDEAGEESR